MASGHLPLVHTQRRTDNCSPALHKREEGSGAMPIRESYLLQPGVQPDQINIIAGAWAIEIKIVPLLKLELELRGTPLTFSK